MSYSTLDKVLAGKIRELLTKEGVEVFLAHHDIAISKEWREEILKHLNSCDALLAVITPNFRKSVWTNQEAGFVIGKGNKVVSLIFKYVDIKKLGFLEAYQGIQTKNENLEENIRKILEVIMT